MTTKEKKISGALHPASPTPKRSPDVTLLDVVHGLMNSRTLRVSETGDVKETFPKELVTMGQSLFPAGKTYDFEIHAAANIASSGAGAINGAIDWNPGVSSFSEWNALSALFNECKLVRSQLDITSAFGPASTAIVVQVMLAPNPNASTTGGYTPVQRLAESEPFHCVWVSKNGTGLLTRKFELPKGRLYAVTSSPAIASPPSGLWGVWSFASNIAGTVSTNYFFYAMKNVVRFRNRA